MIQLCCQDEAQAIFFGRNLDAGSECRCGLCRVCAHATAAVWEGAVAHVRLGPWSASVAEAAAYLAVWLASEAWCPKRKSSISEKNIGLCSCFFFVRCCLLETESCCCFVGQVRGSVACRLFVLVLR